MAHFEFLIGDSKNGTISLSIQIEADSEELARLALEDGIRDVGSQILLSLPALGRNITLKVNPEMLAEARVVRSSSAAITESAEACGGQ